MCIMTSLSGATYSEGIHSSPARDFDRHTAGLVRYAAADTRKGLSSAQKGQEDEIVHTFTAAIGPPEAGSGERQATARRGCHKRCFSCSTTAPALVISGRETRARHS